MTNPFGMPLTQFASSKPEVAAVDASPVLAKPKPSRGPSVTVMLTLRAHDEEQLAFAVAVLRALCEAS